MNNLEGLTEAIARSTSSLDWKLRGEGNANLVLAYIGREASLVRAFNDVTGLIGFLEKLSHILPFLLACEVGHGSSREEAESGIRQPQQRRSESWR